MAHVFKYGATSQQNFTFGGLNSFITQAKAAQKALEAMDFQATTFTDLQTGLNTYLTSYASLKTVFDQVYFSPSNNQFTNIRDPLDGSQDTITFLKTWGNLSEEAVSTGLWNTATQEFVKGPRKANFVYNNLNRYLAPIIGRIGPYSSPECQQECCCVVCPTHQVCRVVGGTFCVTRCFVPADLHFVRVRPEVRL